MTSFVPYCNGQRMCSHSPHQVRDGKTKGEAGHWLDKDPLRLVAELEHLPPPPPSWELHSPPTLGCLVP